MTASTDGDDPARAVAARAGIRLALVAAQQYLPARQRAMRILRDVLGWPAAEVAGLLGTTTTAVNSGLRRARAQLARTLPAEEQTIEPNDPVQRAILDRFTAAFENGDADALAELLRKDAILLGISPRVHPRHSLIAQRPDRSDVTRTTRTDSHDPVLAKPLNGGYASYLSWWRSQLSSGPSLRPAAPAGGAAVEEIAQRAALSSGTVRNYLSSAAVKLGAANRHEAVQMARSRGWI
jgi:hypothetical protein